jgi:hypothetical protein
MCEKPVLSESLPPLLPVVDPKITEACWELMEFSIEEWIQQRRTIVRHPSEYWSALEIFLLYHYRADGGVRVWS